MLGRLYRLQEQFPLLSAVILFFLILARWSSGLPPQITGLPYWYLSYSEGFIRRAFIGTFTMPLLVGRPLMDAVIATNVICTIGTIVLAATLAILFRKSELRLTDPLPVAFLVSGALAFFATDLGNLDVFIELFSIWALVLLYRRNWAGLLLCAVVPLTHEGGAFLLVPLLMGLWAFRPEARCPATAGIAAVGIAVVALGIFSTNQFDWPAGMPAWRPDLLEEFQRSQVGQHKLVVALPVVSFDILLFSILPSLAMVLSVAHRRSWRTALIVLAGVLLTWTLTLIATDTDRLFAWGPFTAVILGGLAVDYRRLTSRAPSPPGEPRLETNRAV